MGTKVVVSHAIELDERAVKECFTKHLDGLAGEDCYIDENGVVWCAEDYGRGSPLRSIVENPSKVQVAALMLQDALRGAQ
jgi:hypothetical protein